MDLELSSDQIDLRDNIRTVLEGLCPPSLVRAVHEATGDAHGLWKQQKELFWPGLAIPEQAGGLGFGFVEVGLLAEELGRAAAPGPLLATISQLAPALAGPHALDYLAEVATGDRTGALAVSEADRWRPDQTRSEAEHDDGGWRVSGTKTNVLSATDVTSFAMLARDTGSGQPGLFLVDAAAATIKRQPSIDPGLGLGAVKFTSAPAHVLVEPCADSGAAITRVLETATVAMAMHTVGACRRIFEATLEYAKVREQYGQVIGSFQALKHRFADLFLAVERAGAVAYYAGVTIAEDDPRRSEAAHAAKIAAGDCQRVVVKDGLQLHGGIGFTWENDLHFLLKRAKAGELLCGTSDQHRRALAALLNLTGGSGQ